jgi:hypothetical protein
MMGFATSDTVNSGDVGVVAMDTSRNLKTVESNSAAILSDTSSIDGKITACDTGSIAGTVTANAGTNLNTSALALESGGNLATIAGDTTSLDSKITACNTGAVVLAAGSAAIGKLAANSGVDIGDVDVTSLPVAAQDTNYFHATITSADATSATQVKAKTAAKKIYVTSLTISVDTAMNVQLQSDNGTPQVVLEQVYLAANGGMALSASDKTLPLFVVNTNEDLDVITSASGNISVTVSGYVV